VPKYTKQIVVFLDILGFSSMLPAFEQEALDNAAADDEGFHESPSLNRLLGKFRESIMWIRERSCNHYMFSDNICITIDYVVEETESAGLFLEVIQLVNLLNYEFIKEGYFLRGGIDAGWFLDSRDMAAGVPLVEAYKIESKIAIHPRVVISEAFGKLIDDMRALGSFSEDEQIVLDKILVEQDGLRFVNGFQYIQNFEDTLGKTEFLALYRAKIAQALVQFENDLKVGPKYQWTAERFNWFLDDYVDDNELYELAGIWGEAELLGIKDLKIN
jgi:hypothetical protein